MSFTNNYPFGEAIIKLVSSHRNYTSKQLRQIGLYTGQDIILGELLQKGTCTQNDLVREINVDHSTIAKSVSRLEKAGYIEKRQSELDKRATEISLTFEGKKIAENVEQIWKNVEKLTIKNLSETEKKLFLNTSEKIAINFEIDN